MAKKPAKLTPSANGICEERDRAAADRDFPGRTPEVTYLRGRKTETERRARTYTAGLIRQLPTLWRPRMFSLGFYPKYSEYRARSRRKLTANRRFLRNPKVTDTPLQLRSLNIDLSMNSAENSILTDESEHREIIRFHIQIHTHAYLYENRCDYPMVQCIHALTLRRFNSQLMLLTIATSSEILGFSTC